MFSFTVLHISSICALNGHFHGYQDSICVKISVKRIYNIAYVVRRLACQLVQLGKFPVNLRNLGKLTSLYSMPASATRIRPISTLNLVIFGLSTCATWRIPCQLVQLGKFCKLTKVNFDTQNMDCLSPVRSCNSPMPTRAL